MTELLKQIMSDKADRLGAGAPDLDAILNGGRAKARKRRLGVGVAGLVALATAAAIVVPMVVGGTDGDHRGTEVAASDAPALSWAEGSVIHAGGETIDVGHEIHAYVASDAGYVFTDVDGVVWAWAEGAVTEVGQVRDLWSQVLVADGDRVAWLDVTDDDWRFVVLDQRTGTRSEAAAVVPASVRAEGHDFDDDTADSGTADAWDSFLVEHANVNALHGALLWAVDARGVVAMDIADGSIGVFAPPTDGYVVDDASGPRMLFSQVAGDAGDQDSPATYASADFGSPGEPLPVSGGDLSPDGRYVMSENSARSSDDFTLYDFDEGRVRDVTANGKYDFFTGFVWLDSDTFLAIGMDELGGEDDWSVELLTCIVSSDTCEPVTGGPPTKFDGFQLPIGEHIGD